MSETIERLCVLLAPSHSVQRELGRGGSLSRMGRSAQLALASGDTVAARQTANTLLSYWPIAERAFPLRNRVVAIVALGPK